ncbi:phenylalanine--tRNA ligase subunit alpha [Halococcus saccharolyticus]|uniref:Phenylalanine--tRNA ligase alpha subunit n=1 Tax=Halococcus saccharolyticus DSM 5350 TaxID=1227455 RepID=M0MES7_9EURY|nr:phenylalanine--tRNA ligase subunit alpha [Halococcus saccharolyticus]EMA43174.1 phenylalanyl-tRNA ligase subunit alpha [Halococcus saccharolyticus DSM 5350]
MKLPAAQVAVLEAASANDAQPMDHLAETADLEPATVAGAAFALEEEGLVGVTERVETSATLTDEGRQYLENGLPETELFRVVREAGTETDLGSAIDAADLDGPQVDIALSNYARKGYGSVESGTITADPDADPDDDPERRVLAALADGESIADEAVLDRLGSRNLINRHEDTYREVWLTDDGITALMEGVETADTVGEVTPELLTTGEWRDVEFAEYNVEADAEQAHGGRIHVLRRTAERVKDVLVGMGFEEMDGPHVDADFWINDCLFMPQDHPARTHWGRFEMEQPTEIDDLPADLVERVRAAHRDGVDDGEGYHSPWDESFARKLALRGHTTSLSARYLSGLEVGELEPPQRFFSVEKVYRNDTLDATHLLEFFQIEGLVMAENLSVRDLMGTFTEFYEQFGITDLEFKPTYNPYTEPSFELFGEHPVTGEIVEIGNSGLFRPEMLEPLGVDCDVMAWGLALERLLMLTHGFEDIRDVHGTLVDLDFLRNAEVVY